MFRENDEPHQVRKYIVFADKLMELFQVCRRCGAYTKTVFKEVGTMLTIIQNCIDCLYCFTWKSQPAIGSMPLGNLLLSASILFSGSLVSKTLRVLDIMNIAHQNRSRIFSHQKKYLFPTVFSSWATHKRSLLDEIKNTGSNVILAGDGRSDSPGFSAKYGTYTLMDCQINKILEIQTVQVSTVVGIKLKALL